MPDIEDVLAVLKTSLESDAFAAKLEAVFARKTDDAGVVELPVVYATQMFTHETFPVIELSPNMSRNVRNDSDVIDLLHEVYIFWHERHDDLLVLEKRIVRALRAIREYFEEHKTLTTVGSVAYLGDENFSPFVPADVYDGRPFLKSGLLQIYVRTFG